MKATKTCVAATRFQYDYLNDDIDENGEINYSLTDKIPQGLRDAIASGKKVLILINPPYAEAMSADNTNDNTRSESKKGVQKTKVAEYMDNNGYASRELFVQFLVRISKEIPNATLAMFSTLKYVNAPNFEGFRKDWSVIYMDGFIVDSKSFEGLNGKFPIGFLVWKTENDKNKKTLITEISVDILDKQANPIGEKKFYNIPSENFLSTWIKRPRSNNIDTIPLKNAISPTINTKDVRGNKWADGAIGSLMSKGNDLQNAGTGTAIYSSGYCSAGALFITAENLRQAAIVFSVRRLIKPTWINDRDQFLQPNCELSDEFRSDCLIYMLFSGSNLTASANDLERNDRKWSIVNHFIPYTEAEVDSPERFESDFMVQYISDLPNLKATGNQFSAEAQAVLDAGRTLRKTYFAHTDSHTIRDEYKLNRADVGRYQIRNALKKRNESGDFPPVSFTEFETAYKNLTEKLRPLVYEYGFLKA